MERKNYNTLLSKVFLVGKKKNILYGIMLFVMTIFANLLILSILYFGGQLVIDDELSIGDLTSFVLYTITLTIGFASLSGIMNQTISAIGIC
jgi:ABC-type bacteriocin/lantibiotic exporter with double-glycine peptidase domain